MGTVFGRLYIVPLLGEFLRRFPDIRPDWHFDNRQVDLIGQGFDAAIGGGFDLPLGVVARKLTVAHRVLVASAAYLEGQAPVREPDDLRRCTGILIRSPQTGRVRSWQLTGRDGEQQPLNLPSCMTLSDSDAACAVAAQGLGVALVSMPFAVPWLRAGSLQRVLPDWHVDDGHISIYYATPTTSCCRARPAPLSTSSSSSLPSSNWRCTLTPARHPEGTASSWSFSGADAPASQ